MGLDMLGVAQFKTPDGLWVDIERSKYWDDIFEDRDYILFSVLANARYMSPCGEAIAADRGWPDDFDPPYVIGGTYIEYVDHWEITDGTGARDSWASAQELLDWFNSPDHQDVIVPIRDGHAPIKEEIAYFFNKIQSLQDEFGEVRIVFGFY